MNLSGTFFFARPIIKLINKDFINFLLVKRTNTIGNVLKRESIW